MGTRPPVHREVLLVLDIISTWLPGGRQQTSHKSYRYDIAADVEPAACSFRLKSAIPVDRIGDTSVLNQVTDKAVTVLLSG
jgi:hypothetical protein